MTTLTPEHVLGTAYGTPITWEHPDDAFVAFRIVDALVVDDVDFFYRYTGGGSEVTGQPNFLSKEEAQQYPYHFHPCFAEINECVVAQMARPLKLLNQDQQCLFVVFQEALGMLLFNVDDAIDIMRRDMGVEMEETQLHYQLQFMRFSQEAMDRMGVTQEYLVHLNEIGESVPQLQVNFAPYQKEE